MFNVDFLSPNGKFSFSDVTSLAAKTDRGAFVIMANHEKAVMKLVSDVVEIRDAARGTTLVNVANAILSVENNDCIVLADSVSVDTGDPGSEKK